MNLYFVPTASQALCPDQGEKPGPPWVLLTALTLRRGTETSVKEPS